MWLVRHVLVARNTLFSHSQLNCKSYFMKTSRRCLLCRVSPIANQPSPSTTRQSARICTHRNGLKAVPFLLTWLKMLAVLPKLRVLRHYSNNHLRLIIRDLRIIFSRGPWRRKFVVCRGNMLFFGDLNSRGSCPDSHPKDSRVATGLSRRSNHGQTPACRMFTPWTRHDHMRTVTPGTHHGQSRGPQLVRMVTPGQFSPV